MREEAVKKITDEMEKSTDDCIKALGNMIIEIINCDEAAQQKVLEKDKTLMGCFKEIMSEARKATKANYAVYVGEKGYKDIQNMALKYYGITLKVKGNSNTNKVISIDKYKKDTGDVLNIDLDDLI